VSVSCMSLSMILGFRNLHIFGFDCMFKQGGTTHSKQIAGQSLPIAAVIADIGDEKVITTHSFSDFARNALEMVWAGHQEGLLKEVKFYGESLINKMWDGKFYANAEEAEKSLNKES